MLEDGRSGRRFVDLISLAVGMVLLCCLFVACWLLLQTPDGVHLSAGAPASSWSATASSPGSPLASAAPDARTPPRFEIASLARSRQTLTMACVLLAGLVGGYLQYMRERFSELAAPQLPRGPSGSHAAGGRDGAGALFAFVSQLLMGLGAASVLGLFIPLAISHPPGLSIYNPWALLILGVISGYLSRNMFGGLQARFERLFAELHRAEPLGALEVTSAVKQGVLDALGSPRLVNFDGGVRLDVLDRDQRSRVGQAEGRTVVDLRPSEQYTARILFSRTGQARRSVSGGPANEQRIRIDRGIDAHPIPFQLRLELGFLPELAALEQSVELAEPSREGADHFDFSFIAAPPDKDAPAEPTELVLFVYQHSLFCAAVSLQVRWELRT